MDFDTRTYDFTCTSTMAILIHADDVEAGDELMAWRKNPRNKTLSVPGDDRSPAWTWQTYLYHDGEHLALPQQNLMAALRYAGTKIAGKGKATFKSLSQSGLLIPTDFLEFRSNGEQIAIADLHAFKDETFGVHKQRVQQLGFDLMAKRAKVGSSKHVRVRAKFDRWTVSGSVQVYEPAITTDVLEQMFAIAGRYAGLCDWRPSSKESPGPYGTFTVELAQVKAKTKRAG